MIRLAIALLVAATAPALAGEFEVKNCSKGTITLQGYNQNDDVLAFSSSSEIVHHTATGKVRCGTGTCKMGVSGSLPTKVFGPFGDTRCVIRVNEQYEVYVPTIVDCTEWCR